MMNLPIDIIPGTDPPKFKWRRTISTPIGLQTIDCEGMLPVSLETAVAKLIDTVKQQHDALAELKRVNSGLADRIAQSDKNDTETNPKPVSPSRKVRG